MKIPIKKQDSKKYRHHLTRGHTLEVEGVAVLKYKKVKSRKAFHNFSGKTKTIKGFRKLTASLSDEA